MFFLLFSTTTKQQPVRQVPLPEKITSGQRVIIMAKTACDRP
jgi:hypothetical protein